MEKFELKNFPTSESAKKMLSYVSDGFYDESYVGKWIYQVMGIEYDKALEIVMDLPAQFFPETATWGLRYHEIKWGLPIRENLSYEERRALIYQKRDCRAPMTPYRMEKYLKNEMEFEAFVTDCHDPGMYGYTAWHPNAFRVTFIGEGTLNTKKARKILDRIKQAHTTFTMEDMVLVIIDNKSLEKVEFDHMEIQAFFRYFKRILNGGWLLDGSVSLGQIPICEIDLGVMIGNIDVTMKETPCVQGLDIRAMFPMTLRHWYSMEIGHRFDSTRLQMALPDVGINLSARTDMVVWTEGVTIEKDLWRLDGRETMDGSRILDAAVWEEEL